MSKFIYFILLSFVFHSCSVSTDVKKNDIINEILAISKGTFNGVSSPLIVGSLSFSSKSTEGIIAILDNFNVNKQYSYFLSNEAYMFGKIDWVTEQGHVTNISPSYRSGSYGLKGDWKGNDNKTVGNLEIYLLEGSKLGVTLYSDYWEIRASKEISQNDYAKLKGLFDQFWNTLSEKERAEMKTYIDNYNAAYNYALNEAGEAARLASEEAEIQGLENGVDTNKEDVTQTITNPKPSNSIDFSFEDYKVNEVYNGQKYSINLESKPLSYSYQAAIIEGYNAGNVDFAGYYVTVYWGCGTGCVVGVIIDARTGDIYDLPDNESNSNNYCDTALEGKREFSRLYLTSKCEYGQTDQSPLYFAFVWNEFNKVFEPL